MQSQKNLRNVFYCFFFFARNGVNRTKVLQYIWSRQDPEGMYAAVIPKFTSMILNQEIPQIHGDGEQTRDFTYISNAVNANINALFTENKKAFGEVFNIACGDRISINRLYELIMEIISNDHPEISDIGPVHVESRAGM